MVLGSCLAFGPKNWVRKKYLIQETLCSVSYLVIFMLFVILWFVGNLKGYFTQQ